MNMRKGIRCMLSLTLVLALIANTLMGGVVSTKAETTATTGGAIDVTTGSAIDAEDETPDSEYFETEDAEEEEEGELEVDEPNDEIKITTNITAKWDHHYNMDVTVKNISGDRIDDWEIGLTFKNKIENIWNAKITNQNEAENQYTIKNATWNQDIKADDSVSFGMTVYYENEIDEMKDYYLTRMCQATDQNDYKIEYEEYSHWDNKVTGRYVITNTSDRTIEDWKLGLTTNLTYDQMWNGEYIDGRDEEYFENMGYNQNIEPGQSQTIGFIATVIGDKVEIYNDCLYEMITIPDEYVGDPDWEEEYLMDEAAYYDLGRDFFDTDESFLYTLNRSID